MADAITIQALQDASLDAKSLEEVVNGDDAKQVTTRLGESYPSVKKAIKTLFENGGLPATPFATKALMTASALVDGDYAMVTDDTVNNGLYVKTAGSWVLSNYDTASILKDSLADYLYEADHDLALAITDKYGSIAAGVTTDGVFTAKALSSSGLEVSEVDLESEYSLVITDKDGKACVGVKEDGSVIIPSISYGVSDDAQNVKKLSAITSDSIIFVGDSHTASHTALKDKAYISNVSNLCDYRVKNFGISGNESLDMARRMALDIAYFDGLKPSEHNFKYAVIASYDNDAFFRNVSLDFYAKNLDRLVKTIKACGIVPMLSTEFNTDANGYATIQQVAMQNGVKFIDSTSLNYELGGLKKGAFHQGHPGTRTNGVFWISILKAVKELRSPTQSVKIFRKRKQLVVSSLDNLLYANTIERYKRFKELTISHKYLDDSTDMASRFDELDTDGISGQATAYDEYRLLGDAGVDLQDYSLVELTFDGNSQTVSDLNIDIDIEGQGVRYYIRDFLEPTTVFDGKSQGVDGSTPEYVTKYKKPLGKWVEYSLEQLNSIQKLNGLMFLDKMQLLVYTPNSAVLKDVNATYISEGKVADKPNNPLKHRGVGDNILSSSYATISGWAKSNATNIVPIDSYNSPRKDNDPLSPVDSVVQLPPSASISGSVTLPNLGSYYKLTIWSRYFAKAFIDNSIYSFDVSQVVDKRTYSYPDGSPINSDTADVRDIVVKLSFGEIDDATTVTEVSLPVFLSWENLEYDFFVPNLPLGNNLLNITITTPNGDIQIAKVSLQEII